jgi:hypothetical protein
MCGSETRLIVVVVVARGGVVLVVVANATRIGRTADVACIETA